MTVPHHRSRTFRRVFKRTPSGKNVLHHRRRKDARPQCADCKGFLAGVPRGPKNKVHKIPRSARRPERPFGGKLCSACTRRVLIARVRQ